MSTMRLLFRSSMARTAETFINILVGLLMLPFMMSHLGENLYGIWILIGGFTATLHLVDFGFASAVTRFVTRALEEKKEDTANTVISSSLVVYTALALLVLLITLIIAFISHIWVEDPANLQLVRNLILVTGLTLALSFPFKAFAGISKAYLRYDLESLSRIIIKLLSTCVLVYLLIAGYELMAVALIGLFSSLISNVVFFSIAKHLFQHMKVKASYIKWETIKSLSGYSGWAFGNDMTRLLHEKLDIFMIGAYLGTSSLATYYVAIRLVEYSLQFLGRATGITTPLFTASHARGDMGDLRDKTMIFVRINLLLGGFAVYFFVLIGDSLIRLWMGVTFEYSAAYLALCIVMAGKILLFIFGPLASALMAISRHHWLAYLSTAEVSLSGLIIFCSLTLTDMELAGVAIGVSAPFFLTRALILPFIMKREINLKKRDLAKGIAFPLILIVISGIVSVSALKQLNMGPGMPGFIISALLISTIYWSLALLSLKGREWMYLIQILPNKFSQPLTRRFSGSY